MGSAPPWAGAAAPASAVRRRENLRSASFRDYAMAGVTPALSIKARWHRGPVLTPRSVVGGMKEESPARCAAGAAAPASAVKRRENLRSASFRDYAMAGVTPALSIKARWHRGPVLTPRSIVGGMKEESPARCAAGAAAPAPTVKRRENLHSASFPDCAMAGVTPALSINARWH